MQVYDDDVPVESTRGQLHPIESGSERDFALEKKQALLLDPTTTITSMAPKVNANGSKKARKPHMVADAVVVDTPAARPSKAVKKVRTEAPASISGASFSWSHLLLVIAFNAVLMSATLWSHYHLPSPKPITVSSLSSPAHFSEVAALDHISVLSDKIGYRIVGTKQHVEAEEWVESIVKQYEGWHRTAVDSNATVDPRGDTQVEVWTQIGDGSHR